MHTQDMYAFTQKMRWEIQGRLRSLHYISVATGLANKGWDDSLEIFLMTCPLLLFTRLTFRVPLFFSSFIITLKIAPAAIGRSRLLENCRIKKDVCANISTINKKGLHISLYKCIMYDKYLYMSKTINMKLWSNVCELLFSVAFSSHWQKGLIKF